MKAKTKCDNVIRQVGWHGGGDEEDMVVAYFIGLDHDIYGPYDDYTVVGCIELSRYNSNFVAN